jgi:uncharacterized membrane protein
MLAADSDWLGSVHGTEGHSRAFLPLLFCERLLRAAGERHLNNHRMVCLMTLELLAVLVLGLMCGSELNVAAFAHPTLNQQPPATNIRVRSSMAVLFGRLMPFWMSGSALLTLLLLLPFEHLSKPAWHFAAIALTLQVVAIVFSLVGPVPINNRIAKWKPESVPSDWRAQEDRWDLYHWVRTVGLIVAFALLVLAVGNS